MRVQTENIVFSFCFSNPGPNSNSDPNNKMLRKKTLKKKNKQNNKKTHKMTKSQHARIEPAGSLLASHDHIVRFGLEHASKKECHPRSLRFRIRIQEEVLPEFASVWNTRCFDSNFCWNKRPQFLCRPSSCSNFAKQTVIISQLAPSWQHKSTTTPRLTFHNGSQVPHGLTIRPRVQVVKVYRFVRNLNVPVNQSIKTTKTIYTALELDYHKKSKTKETNKIINTRDSNLGSLQASLSAYVAG